MAADPRLRLRGLWLSAALLLGVPAAAQDNPLSAIDWLSNSVLTGTTYRDQPNASRPVLPPVIGEAPVSSGLRLEDVAVFSLDAPTPDAIGLLSARRTGLPRDLWGSSPEAELAAMLRKERADTLPAIQGLLMELLLAELAPPEQSDKRASGLLFLARVDKLLDLGALEPALAMLAEAPANHPEIFRRRFDAALLIGEEDRACEAMAESPLIAPSLQARVFCLARGGDWEAAALLFGTGRVLEPLPPETDALLERFLEPELDDAGPLPPPSRPSPLVFRMMEAIGEPLPTNDLPVAFAQSDLRANNGWKARLEAGERLARTGVLDANQMLGLYTENDSGPSGALWDRVRAMSRLDAAMRAGETETVAEILPEAYALMETVELEPLLGRLWGEDLAKLELPPETRALAFRIGLLSPAYEKIAQAHTPTDLDERLLIGLARGSTAGIPAQDQLGLLLKRVFDRNATNLPDAYRDLVPGQLGLALLRALDDVTEGAKGDYTRLEAGLRLLRMSGLEDEARRAALELLILERRG
ncbi:hypothetical protein [Pseudothioclava arenosa]|uniref:hypothetical protein n=1 Tax=Pseudothioclava arenosa TaxID=1795308 RepID=UPI001FE87599|nr:hypothetical protein [Pseudothioclava arenosa]